jgi:hypothetical protein
MKTPAEYIAAADEAKQGDLKKLHALIRKTLPDLKPCMVHGMIGYGPYHYKYASGREGDTARVALASNKTGFSVYVSAIDQKGRYLAEQAKAKLGKASVGKACIRFEKLADLELDALRDVLEQVRTARPLGGTTDTPDGKASARSLPSSGTGRRSARQSSRPEATRSRAKRR